MRKREMRRVIRELVQWIRAKKVVVGSEDKGLIERAVGVGFGLDKGVKKAWEEEGKVK